VSVIAVKRPNGLELSGLKLLFVLTARAPAPLVARFRRSRAPAPSAGRDDSSCRRADVGLAGVESAAAASVDGGLAGCRIGGKRVRALTSNPCSFVRRIVFTTPPIASEP